MICVFTSNVRRMASEADQWAFEESVRQLHTGSFSEGKSSPLITNTSFNRVLDHVNPELHAH